MRYDQLLALIALYKPRKILEVGTNKGDRAIQMCNEALKFQQRVAYRGYDVFDSEGSYFHQRAFNGKGYFPRNFVAKRFNEISSLYPRFQYNLIEGNTQKTLHPNPTSADFVFIDGDHRAEMVEADYRALKRSRVVILDDYYTGLGEEGTADASQVGCNKLVGRIPATILPMKDHFPHVGDTQMAVIVRPHLFLQGRPLWIA